MLKFSFRIYFARRPFVVERQIRRISLNLIYRCDKPPGKIDPFNFCYNNFDAIIESLKTKNETSFVVKPNTLAFVPTVTVKLNRDKEFVENCLENWWFKLNLNEENRYSRFFAHTIHGLRHINERTSDGVLKCLGMEPFEKLTRSAFSNPDCQHIRYIQMIFKSLSMLHNSESLDRKISPQFLQYLTDFLIKYFAAIYRHEIRLGRDNIELEQNFYSFLPIMDNLGINNLPKHCQNHIVKIFVGILKIWRRRSMTEMKESQLIVTQIFAVTSTFLKWRLDADEFYEYFWDKCFQEIVICFDRTLDLRINRFRAQVLKSCLYITLEFDKERLFLMFRRQFWFYIKCNFPHLDESELREILDKIQTKYSHHPFPRKMAEQLLSREILKDVFRSRLGD